MSTQEKPVLEAASRANSGKGVARKLRAQGNVPAVIYGQHNEPRLLSVSAESIVDLFETEMGQNVVFDLKIDGGDVVENVMVKSYQASPVKRNLLHVDFYIIDLDQVIRTKVPIKATGRAKGVRAGGILNVIRPDIDIKARPMDIPAAIFVDVSDLEPGMTIQAEHVVLPEGVMPGFKANYGLFRVVIPRKRAAVNAEGEEGEGEAAAIWPLFFVEQEKTTVATYLIVGLGNPGAQYAKTRHNIGFMALERLAERFMLSITGKKFKGHWCKGVIAGNDAILLLPQTFMNLSGGSVQPAAAFYNIDVEHIIVVHDELDLECGDIRIKKGGGHGGHNGLRDIIQKLGDKDFIRLRMGIGRPSRGDVTGWVLGAFGSSEEALRDEMIEQACDALEALLAEGVIAAQNRFNGSN